MPRTFLVVCLLVFALPWRSSHASEQSYYTVGIVPQQATTKLVRSWTPLLELITEISGIELRFKTATDIPAFENRLYTSEYDFAYMNPYHYVEFNKRSGYRAIARERDKLIQGIIVTHRDSRLKTVEELHQQTLAFPSPAAFAASILPRAELQTRRITINTRYVGSHDSVYHMVARKRFIAGGGIARTLQATNPEIRKQLRILWVSDKHTPHAFAVHSRVAPGVVSAVQSAMIQLHTTPAGRNHLQALRLNGFIGATDSDWDDIRKLEIESLFLK